MQKSFFSISTIVITWLLFAVSLTFADDVQYVCEVAGNVKRCEEKDYKLICDLQMTKKDDHVYLEGTININQDLGDDDEIKIDIVKQQDNGVNDPVFSVVTSVCDAMKDKDTAWYSIFEKMGIDGCPIKAGEYKIEDLRFSLDSMNSYMTHEYVGDYGCQLVTSSKADQTSCHVLGVSIMEAEEE